MNYCADHDPILQAGQMGCLHCDALVPSNDATWVDPSAGLILATYPSPCEHHEAVTYVVSVADLKPRTEPRETTFLGWTPPPESRRCTARRKDGAPCSRYRMDGYPYCYAHRNYGEAS